MNRDRPAAFQESPPANLPPGGGGSPSSAGTALLPSPAEDLNEQRAPGALLASRAAITDAVDQSALQRAREDGLASAPRLTVDARMRLDAQLAIIAAWQQWDAGQGLERVASLTQFTKLWNAGEIACDPVAREIYRSVSRATLHRWCLRLGRSGLAGLPGRYGNRRGGGIIDTQPQLERFALGMLAEYPHASAASVHEAMRARFGSAVNLPHYRTLGRWLRRWKTINAQLYTAIANPDAWRSRYMMALGAASQDVTRLNQRWELDSTPADVLLTDGRHAVIGVVDVYSRRARLLVARTSKASAIASLMRRALMEWGVPESVKTDNGKDYVSKHLVRIFQGLDIAHQICAPFSPHQKPFIERFFRTFSHDLVELLTGYIGHSVAERQAIRSRRSFAERLMQRGGELEIRIDAATFSAFCDRWVDAIYQHQGHRGLSGASPFLMAAQWAEPVRRISDERALDVLLAEAPGDGLRTVTKKGVRVERFEYVHEALGLYVGAQVRVLYDPEDIGSIYVFGGPEMEFICVAQCPEFTGISRQAVAAVAREKQKAHVQAARAAIKALASEQRLRDIAEEVLAAAERTANVVMLPKPAEPHETPALRAALDAVLANKRPPRVFSEADAAAQQSLMAEMGAQVRAIEEDPRETYWRFQRIARRIRDGNLVSEAERDFHETYGASPERQAMHEFFEAFAAQEAE